MIREIIMPQLGMGMSEGTIVEWKIKEGERVARDQPLISIETEKVVTDLPAAYEGWVHIVVAAGTTVPIETLIAQVADTESEYRKLVGTSESEPAAAAPVAAVSARAAAAPAPMASGRLKVSGLARRLARENGIDLSKVTGTGPGGRIVKRDLAGIRGDAPVAVQVPPVPATAAMPAPVQPLGIREKLRIPVVGMRRTIAERMSQAKHVAVHTHSFFEVEVTKLLAVRQTLREREKEIGTRISMTAIYTRVLALACRDVPICNAALIDGEIILWDEVNVGIGVALPGRTPYDSGLVVPVVRNADTKGLLQIDQEIRALVARAREGALRAEDVANATITMSSIEKLNNGGWMAGTPILSLPQVVAFGPGAPVRKPIVADDGQIVAGNILPCSVTYDHRALDGEPIGRLVRRLTDFLGHPELLLL